MHVKRLPPIADLLHQPWVDRVAAIMPGMRWMRSYQRAWLWRDLLAGVSMAAVIVPLAMAYGQLSGLPPIVGIYASLLPLVAYSLFGTSKHLIIGPDASTTALMVTVIAPLAGGNVARFAALAGTLALLVGVLFVAAGVMRLGFIADFLSKPILIGYMNGLSLTVVASQLGKLSGIQIGATSFLGQVGEFLGKFGQVHWPTFLLGLVVLIFLVVLHSVAPQAPGPIIAIVGATVLTIMLHLDAQGVVTLGYLTPGLPAIRIPQFSLRDVGTLSSEAAGIALLIFSDTILNARTFARRGGYQVDVQRELIALGMANAAAGISGGYPVSASGARTAINESLGSKSQLSGLVAAVVLALILVGFTSLLGSFPVTALGAILISVMVGLLDIATMRQLYRQHMTEFLIALVTLIGVLLAGLIQGIVIAVLLSFLFLLFRAVRPHDAVLGRVEGIEGYHDVEDYPTGETIPGLIVYRFDAPLFFANAQQLKARALSLVASASPAAKWFLLDAEAITDLDSTAAETLHELDEELGGRGVTLVLARAKGPLRERLARTGLAQLLTPERLFPSVRSAVDAFLATQPPDNEAG